MPSASPPAGGQSASAAADFPSPSTFSIIPDVYLLVARLNILHTAPSHTQPQITPNGASQPHAQPTTGPLPTGSTVDVKDLAAQVYPIKQKLAQARAAVTKLPDVARTVEEQEAEIRALGRRVARLNERMALLGAIAGKRATNQPEHDVVMKGVEG